MSRPKLIVILGPTGSGKSELAIKLAKKFSGQIVSADSRQIYQEMDIGTAKITKDPSTSSGTKNLLPERSEAESKAYISDKIPHHLIDIIRPDQEFTLARYKKEAIKIIKDIQKKNKLPFLVGGTGLYIQAVIDNLQIPQVKPDKRLRNKLERLTNQELYQRLEKLDPSALGIIDINNKRRMIRALEVCLKTKKPFSQQKQKGQTLFNVLQIGLKLDKKTLEKRINQRVKEMFKAGLVQEVEKLIKKYRPDLPSMSGIGYQEIIPYLQNKISLQQAKELIKLHTRQYARRQMTWFKRDQRIIWLDNYKKAEQTIKQFL